MSNEQLLSLENNAKVIVNMRQHKCLVDTHLVCESPPVYDHPVLANEGLISHPCFHLLFQIIDLSLL